MKLEAWFSLVMAWLFTLCAPFCFWLQDWVFTKATAGYIVAAVTFWFGYFRAVELDKKISEQRRREANDARRKSLQKDR